MKPLIFFALVLSTTHCAANNQVLNPAQPLKDCSLVSASDGIDDCYRHNIELSNTLLAEELKRFEKDAKAMYSSDLDLGAAYIYSYQQAHEAWLTYRDAQCQFQAFEIEKGTPTYTTALNSCLIEMNQKRISEMAH